ncbi:hypothetical protein F4703DRAFT_1857814 [Phycomyces blakesleeanus]
MIMILLMSVMLMIMMMMMMIMMIMMMMFLMGLMGLMMLALIQEYGFLHLAVNRVRLDRVGEDVWLFFDTDELHNLHRLSAFFSGHYVGFRLCRFVRLEEVDLLSLVLQNNLHYAFVLHITKHK